MPTELHSVRKNRGQVAKDIMALLAVKNISEITISKSDQPKEYFVRITGRVTR